MNKNKIAISKNGMDYIRICPLGSEENKVEIKFSFLDNSFILRRFETLKNNKEKLFSYVDYGTVPNEITYHNSNDFYPQPSLLPKYKDARARTPISHEIIDLDLRDLIVPIPICRVTVNKESNIDYKQKKYHKNIELTSEYNTTEFYISSSKYDHELMSKRFPMIAQFLFPITSIDYIISGAGDGFMPIMNKMLENNNPIFSLESEMIDKYRIYYRTYKLPRNSSYFIYSDSEYSSNNFIEFFNNIDYLGLLATTKIGFKKDGKDELVLKPAYQFDIENLKSIGFHRDYIKRWMRKFHQKELEYKSVAKSRSGIIINWKTTDLIALITIFTSFRSRLHPLKPATYDEIGKSN